MKLKNKFSTKQHFCLFFIFMGIILLNSNPSSAESILRTISISLVLLPIFVFWHEAGRRYKIITPYTKNNYDSRSEKQIADYFKRKNIIFYHHPQIKVPKPIWFFSMPFYNISLEPDFYLPEFDVYVEYWGLINDPEYKKNSYDRKKKLYQDNVLDMISIYPKNLGNLDFVFTSKLLDVFKGREGNLRHYR